MKEKGAGGESSKSTCLTRIFWALVGTFVLILGQFFVPGVGELLRGSLLFLLPFAIFSLLGAILIFLTLKEKVKGKLKNFLILTGASAAGFFVFSLLHNLIYGLFILFFGTDFWERIGLGDEPFFFLLAIIVCPIGFLIGAVGSMIFFIKRRKRE